MKNFVRTALAIVIGVLTAPSRWYSDLQRLNRECDELSKIDPA